MSNKGDHFFEDFAKMCGAAMDTAFSSVTEAKKQFDDVVKERLEILLKDMNLVTREEFEVVKEMAAKARTENEALSKKIKSLEKKLAK